MNTKREQKTGPRAEGLESRRLLAAGDLDPTFAGDGRVALALGDPCAGLDVAVQADGKIVIAGTAPRASGANSDAILIRLNVDGSLDNSFGTGGIARIDFGGDESFAALAILPGGKIVAGGVMSTTRWMLARFTASGTADAGSAFGGTDGVQTGSGQITELALHGGQIITASRSPTPSENVVRRHHGASGALDTSFGSSGSVAIASAVASLPNFRWLSDLTVQGDGKIIAVGSADGSRDPDDRDLYAIAGVYAIARLTSNGAADASFATGGGFRKAYDEEGSGARAVAVRPSDGAIFVAGHDGSPDANLLQLTPSGQIVDDPLLPAVYPRAMDATDILIDPEGQPVVAGDLPNEDSIYYDDDDHDFLAIRFTTALEKDPTFSGDGEAYVDFPEPGDAFSYGTEFASGAALDPQGRIVMAGTSTIGEYDGSQRIAVARLLTDDPSEPSIAIQSRVLRARGTGEGDTFSVRRVLTDDVVVTVNGLARTFDMDDFTGVRLEGLGGDDTFNLIDPLVSPLVSPLVRNTTVLGGTGTDTISYATRTAALNFDIQTVVSRMNSGAQSDQFDEVETVVGGNGADAFELSTFLSIPPEEENLRFDFRLEGRGGNDSFDTDGGVSNNFGGITVRGGDGDDFVAVNDSPPVPLVFGDGGNDYFQLANEVVAKGRIDGGGGTDTVDWFNFGTVRDLRDHVSVENAVVGVSGATVFGTDGPNRIVTARDAHSVVIHGLGGNDTIVAGGGSNTLLGEAGDDSLSAGGGDDTLDGGPGTDTLDGGPGDDTLLNGEVTPPAGRIRIIDRILTADGTWGGDDVTIERVGGDDVIVRVNDLSRQFDMDDFDGVLLRGNNGYDVLAILDPIVAGPRVRKVTLDGGNGNDTLLGFSESSDDVLRGGAGNDWLSGGGGRDALFGGIGNDVLWGDPDPDFLDGGDNADVLFAVDGAGGDTVLGGNGTDTARIDPGDNASGVEKFE